jgi:hypothetical protein
MTSVFSSKLDRLIETVGLVVEEAVVDDVARSLRASEGSPVVAIGSGGSTVSADFLAACRMDLWRAATFVTTPMAYVLDATTTPNSTWLFSASGENPDILAALNAAVEFQSSDVCIVTSAEGGSLARLGREKDECSIHVAPVADPKDGFLATHSVVAAAALMILAADAIAGSIARRERARVLLEETERILSPASRGAIAANLVAFSERDTVILLYDPRLSAAAQLVETSFWEAGICAVQCADFRNFAHGRHVWASRHPERSLVLALTCDGSRSAWGAIREALPRSIAVAEHDFGRAGRGALFEAILTMLAVVEAGGSARGIDPGKPGVADFGRRIFESSDLHAEGRREDISTRRKRRAAQRVDHPPRIPTAWRERRDRFIADLGNTEIRGVVLDYDGTIVSTEARLVPPPNETISRIVQFVEHGLTIGVATGRGGSLREMMHDLVPAHLRAKVLVGYYNGGYIVPLSVDIEKHTVAQDPVIEAAYSRLITEPGLFQDEWRPKLGPLQLSLPLERFKNGQLSIARAESIVRGLGDGIRILRSEHSVDMFPAWASKRRVVDAVRKAIGEAAAAVLTIGDRGDCQGNDFDLLEGSLGLSVGSVCHREDSCWNLLPAGMTGPGGLLKILLALHPTSPGLAKLEVSECFAGLIP